MEPYHCSTINARGPSVPIPPAAPAGFSGWAGIPAGAEAEPVPHEALSITCLVQNPTSKPHNLLCGIDTLHVGLFVDWSDDSWPEWVIHFQEQKESAFGTTGVIDQTPLAGHSSMRQPPEMSAVVICSKQFASMGGVLFLSGVLLPLSLIFRFLMVSAGQIWPKDSRR